MINNTEDLSQIVEEKLKAATSEEEIKTLSHLKLLFRKPTCFFDIPSNVALNILVYLGVPEQEVLETYRKLISPEVFRQIPKVRIIVDEH